MRVTIIGLGLTLAVVGGIGYRIYTSSMLTRQNISREQPIPFSHQRHVGGNGLDCRMCHESVEHSAFAGIPSTETCMTCHSQILSDAPMLQAAQESFKTGEPIAWNRVYDLPDFVYFNHSVHIAKGVGCTTCHGNIDEQRLTMKANTLHMSWCLACHRAPEKFIRPKEEVYNVDWVPPRDQIARGKKLVEEYDVRVRQLDNCSICHR